MAGFNPNRKKKTYSFGRSQPSQIVSASRNGHIEFFDETLVSIDNPFYIIDIETFRGNPPPPPPLPIGEYDEDVVNFSWQDNKTETFNMTFSSNPIVTLEILTSNGYENINAFIENVTTTGFKINVSAPLTGQIVYRAIYSTTYPAIVSRSISSSSYYYTASAGYGDLNDQYGLVTTYSALSGGTVPSQMFFAMDDVNQNKDANVAIVSSSSFGIQNTTIYLSAPITNRIYYLAVKP